MPEKKLGPVRVALATGMTGEFEASLQPLIDILPILLHCPCVKEFELEGIEIGEVGPANNFTSNVIFVWQSIPALKFGLMQSPTPNIGLIATLSNIPEYETALEQMKNLAEGMFMLNIASSVNETVGSAVEFLRKKVCKEPVQCADGEIEIEGEATIAYGPLALRFDFVVTFTFVLEQEAALLAAKALFPDMARTFNVSRPSWVPAFPGTEVTPSRHRIRRGPVPADFLLSNDSQPPPAGLTDAVSGPQPQAPDQSARSEMGCSSGPCGGRVGALPMTVDVPCGPMAIASPGCRRARRTY